MEGDIPLIRETLTKEIPVETCLPSYIVIVCHKIQHSYVCFYRSPSTDQLQKDLKFYVKARPFPLIT